ncbi:MAG: hypothetical protein ABI905_12990 [Betaproteobacteria bacterium]
MKNRKFLTMIALAFASVLQLPHALAQTVAPSAVNEKSPELRPLSGTLFFTDQERARMDRARKSGVAMTADGMLAPAPPSVLNGFVKRSDGQTTIWVDGQPRPNVQGTNVQQLRPQDVGGVHESLKIRVSGPVRVDAIAPVVKPASKRPVPRKTVKRRPAT